MTQEEKQLLLIDICARLPYGVKVHIEHDVFYDEIEPYDSRLTTKILDDFLRMERLEVKPYLRPMSSMTEEENEEYGEIIRFKPIHAIIDWFNANYFDYRGLIPMGLALEAPEGMYNIKAKE